MELTANQRLKLLLKSLIEKRIIYNQQDFAERIGFSKAIISQIMTGRKSPSNNLLTKVSKIFPFVESTWLLTGEGEMLKTGPTQVVNGAGAHHFTQTGDVESTPEMMNRLLDEMKAQREDYRTTIDKLLGIHQQLADTYHSLLHELTKK